MLKSVKLNKFQEISHCFFNRNGGYSNGIYKSLNCGIGSKDKKTNILKNLKKVKEIIFGMFKKCTIIHVNERTGKRL